MEAGRNYFLTKLQLFPINSRQTDKSKSFQLILKSHFAKGGFCGALPGDAGVQWGEGPAAPDGSTVQGSSFIPMMKSFLNVS